MSTTDQHHDIEAVLRGELAARAGTLAVGEAPYPTVNRAVRRDRNRRRAGASLVLAAALAATLPSAIGALNGTSTVGAASGSAPSPLLTAPLRGNLAGDSAFVAAVAQRLDASGARTPHGLGGGATNPAVATGGYVILYANDDGTHRVAIGATYNGDMTLFAVLVGNHADAVPALKSANTVGFGMAERTFTYLGGFTGTGGSVPFVVLGPTSMTNVEYATGLTLGSAGGTLTRVRTGIKQAATVNGAAAGEIADAATTAGAARLGKYTVFRAELGGEHIDADPADRRFTPLSGDDLPSGGAYDALRAAVAQQGERAGLAMSPSSPGGDAVPDNVAMVLWDLANFAGVPGSSISYHVDWIGRETAQWDSALLDVSAPGMPKLQIFVRGLAAGAPDSASPGLARSFVRPAATLTAGHLPETASAFGGSPEPTVIGHEVMSTW